MTEGLNQPIFDPSARAGSVDPSLQGNPEHTISLLSEEQRRQAERRMDHTVSRGDVGLSEGQYWQGGDAMVLEDGVRLEEQCNRNYDYLNSQGVSMGQFTGALEGLRTFVLSNQDNYVTHQRQDGGTEQAGLLRTISGRVLNPLSGKVEHDTEYTLHADGPTLDEDTLGPLFHGVMDIEVEMAGHGIFSNVRRNDVPNASCRAEQILTRLRNTEIGQQLLREQGVGDQTQQAEQPIALAAIPDGPTPREQWEAKRAEAAERAERDNLQITAELGDTIKAIKATAQKGDYEVWSHYHRDKGGKGKTYRILVGEEPGSFTEEEWRGGKTYSYTQGTWVEVTEWPKAPREFKIIQSQDYGKGYTFSEFSNKAVWEEGAPARSEWHESSRHGGKLQSRILPAGELTELSAAVAEPNREKLERWRATQARRSRGVGQRVMRLFGGGR